MEATVAAWTAAGVIATALCGMIASLGVVLLQKNKNTPAVPMAPGVPIPSSTLEKHLEEERDFWRDRADLYASELSRRGIPLPFDEYPDIKKEEAQ